MKKVLGAMSKFIFGGFGIAVLALLMSLTYGALQRLFPGNFANQMWGLVMFDIAAMCWALAFVFQSKSTGQYAAAGIGFIVAFIGTLGMVAAEVILSGQNLMQADTAQIGQWMVYGFIIVTAIHAGLVYAHHATAPEIHEQINVGVARGEIVTEAISQATKELDTEKAQLAQTIRHDIVSQVKRDLGLYPVTDTPFEIKKLETEPLPVTWAKQEDATAAARPLHFSQRLRDWMNGLRPQPATPSQAQAEYLAQTSDALAAWQDMPDGSRSRVWCKVCRDQGKAWLTSEVCEHVREAKPEMKIPLGIAMNTLRSLMTEAPQEAPKG